MLAFGSFCCVFDLMNAVKDGGAYNRRFDAYHVDTMRLYSPMYK